MKRLMIVLLLGSVLCLSYGQGTAIYGDVATPDTEPETPLGEPDVDEEAPPPPEEPPRLMIDPQGHLSRIHNVMFTPDGKRLISIGDSTIRMWNVETGEIAHTIHAEDPLTGGILAPDSKMMAVVGGLYRAFEESEEPPIYLFNLESGAKLAQLKGASGHLAFSPDGNWLAGTDEATITLWNLPGAMERFSTSGSQASSGWIAPAFTLEGHTEMITGIAFSPDGKRLVSVAYDGTLRLWELPQDLQTSGDLSDLKSMETKKHPHGIQCVAYSPDGKYLVSGGMIGEIFLWDQHGKFLRELGRLESDIATLAFSGDGSRLVATDALSGHAAVYAFPSGEVQAEFAGHTSGVTACATYGDDLVATAGREQQEIYIWNAATGEAKTRLAGKGRTIWSVAFGKGFRVAFGKTNNAPSKDRARIEEQRQYAAYPQYVPLEQSFDFVEMFLDQRTPSEEDFTRVQLEYQGNTLTRSTFNEVRIIALEQVTDHEYQIVTKNTIANHEHEWAYSYTFTKTGDIVIGTPRLIKRYRQDGTLLREFSGHGGEVYALSLSEDESILASAGADQTIKLWNFETGEHLATLFVTGDADGPLSGEWICWTPQGFYAASAGGEKYIGWQLVRDVEKFPEFLPVSVFRKRFHQPDLVHRTIVLGSFEQAFEEFQLESEQFIEEQEITDILPPEVEWMSPQEPVSETSSPSLQIKAQIHSDTELTDVKILINGRTQTTVRGLKIDEPESSQAPGADNIVDQEITLTPGENVIAIFATNRYAGVTSDDRIVFYRTAEELKPNLYMVSVGISEYHLNNLNLEFADDDAKAISQVFRNQEGGLYHKVNLKELYDQDATQAAIKQATEWLQQETTQKDVAILFIAAHGMNEQGQYYLLPTDGRPDEVQNTGISWNDFSTVLGKLPARVLLLLDTCHSGQLGQDLTVLSKQVDNTEALRLLSSDEYGVVILAASTGRESSLEHPDWGHGAFTKALIEALTDGKADYSNDGTIHLRELDLYIAERVETLTNNEQHPTTQKPSTISRFAVVQVRD